MFLDLANSSDSHFSKWHKALMEITQAEEIDTIDVLFLLKPFYIGHSGKYGELVRLAKKIHPLENYNAD